MTTHGSAVCDVAPGRKPRVGRREETEPHHVGLLKRRNQAGRGAPCRAGRLRGPQAKALTQLGPPASPQGTGPLEGCEGSPREPAHEGPWGPVLTRPRPPRRGKATRLGTRATHTATRRRPPRRPLCRRDGSRLRKHSDGRAHRCEKGWKWQEAADGSDRPLLPASCPQASGGHRLGLLCPPASPSPTSQ